MRERIRNIIKKEFRQAFREPRLRVMLFLPPIVQLIVFGYAVNLDIDSAKIAWMDADQTPQSRELRDAFRGSGRFQIVAYPSNEAEAHEVMDHARATAIISVLPGFGRDAVRGRQTAVQIIVDGTDSNTAALVSGYASSIVTSYSGNVFVSQMQAKLVGRTANGPVSPGVPTLETDTRVWFNPDLRSRNYFVPGVLVNIITIVTLMLTAMAIVREKEIGTLEQLMVTPIRPVELMLGKTMPFALVGLVQISLVLPIMHWLFGVPIRGSLLFLYACAAVYLMSSLGSGIFISTISRTQQQAMLTVFLFFNPAFLLSGFAFPIRNMPQVVQWITYLNPLRYFMEIIRGIFLKGSGPEVLWPPLTALAVFGACVLGVSALRFRKRLE